MVDGVYLTLLAGPVVPVPAPAFVVDALTRVNITIATREETAPSRPPVPARSGFELEFNLGKRSPLETLFLLAGGAANKRMALPNAKILIHQVSGGFSGQAADIEIHAREIIDIRRKLDEIIAKHTQQPLEKVSQDTDRDYFMSAEEAREYNIIDRVISEH